MKTWLEQGERAGEVRGDRAATDLADSALAAWERSLLPGGVEGTTAPLERAVRMVVDDLGSARRP